MTTKGTGTMTKSQERAVGKIKRYYENCHDVKDGTAVADFEIELFDWGAVSVTATTTRTDCHEHSQRAMMCNRYGHFLISKRGKITVCLCRYGLDDFQEHVASIIGGHVWKD